MKNLFLTVILLFGTTANAATLDLGSGGELLGAFNVDVGGTLYDVTFEDGTCPAVFDNCDSLADFAFTNQTDALLAANALMDQVIHKTPDGPIDLIPSLTNGCTNMGSEFFPARCTVYTPFGFVPAHGLLSVTETVNFTPDSFGYLDNVNGRSIDPNQNHSGQPSSVFAVWTVVPIPAAVWLFGSALAGLGWLRRRQTA